MSAVYYNGKWFKSVETKNKYIMGIKKFEHKGEKWHKIRTFGDMKLRTWHNSIGYRDSFKCRVCKNYDKVMGQSHHIEHGEDLKYIETNGIWVFYKCHEAIHKVNERVKYLSQHPELDAAIMTLVRIFNRSKDREKEGEL